MSKYNYNFLSLIFLTCSITIATTTKICAKNTTTTHNTYKSKILKQAIADINTYYIRMGYTHRASLLPHEENYAIENIIDPKNSYTKNYELIKKYIQETENEHLASHYKDRIITTTMNNVNIKRKREHLPEFRLTKKQDRELLLNKLSHIDHKTPPEQIEKITDLAIKCTADCYNRFTVQHIIACIVLAANLISGK